MDNQDYQQPHPNQPHQSDSGNDAVNQPQPIQPGQAQPVQPQNPMPSNYSQPVQGYQDTFAIPQQPPPNQNPDTGQPPAGLQPAGQPHQNTDYGHAQPVDHQQTFQQSQPGSQPDSQPLTPQSAYSQTDMPAVPQQPEPPQPMQPPPDTWGQPSHPSQPAQYVQSEPLPEQTGYDTIQTEPHPQLHPSGVSEPTEAPSAPDMSSPESSETYTQTTNSSPAGTYDDEYNDVLNGLPSLESNPPPINSSPEDLSPSPYQPQEHAAAEAYPNQNQTQYGQEAGAAAPQPPPPANQLPTTNAPDSQPETSLPQQPAIPEQPWGPDHDTTLPPPERPQASSMDTNQQTPGEPVIQPQQQPVSGPEPATTGQPVQPSSQQMPATTSRAEQEQPATGASDADTQSAGPARKVPLYKRWAGRIAHRISNINYKPLVSAGIVGMLIFGIFNSQVILGQVQYLTTPSGGAETSIGEAMQSPASDEDRILIPQIDVDVPVVDEPSFDEERVQEALENGVVHYGNTAKPGEIGNSVIVGHSSNNWWDAGDFKYAFILLDRLQAGDEIAVDYNGIRYEYEVTDSYIVDPDDLSVLEQPDDTAMLTLITCSPPGTNWQRLIVEAEQVSPDPGANVPRDSDNGEIEIEELPRDSGSLFDFF